MVDIYVLVIDWKGYYLDVYLGCWSLMLLDKVVDKY